jgi:hypothetical protein
MPHLRQVKELLMVCALTASVQRVNFKTVVHFVVFVRAPSHDDVVRYSRSGPSCQLCVVHLERSWSGAGQERPTCADELHAQSRHSVHCTEAGSLCSPTAG